LIESSNIPRYNWCKRYGQGDSMYSGFGLNGFHCIFKSYRIPSILPCFPFALVKFKWPGTES
jgi:hypothetical protein